MLLSYMVNIIEASGSVWLDVYRFPRDLWLKELETKQVTVIITLRKDIMFISNARFLEAQLQFPCNYVCWHCFLSCFNDMIMFCCLFCRPHKPQAPQRPNCLPQSYS